MLGFLKTLGKIGGSLIGLGGGGGNENKIVDGILKGIGVAGPVVSAAAKGSADQRMAEGNQALNYGQAQAQQARDQFQSGLQTSNAQFGAGMDAAQFNRTGQDRQRKAAMLSAMLNGVQDANLSGLRPEVASRVPTISGGLRPSAITGNKDALMQLLSQPETQAPTYNAPAPYVAPNLPQQPTAGAGEKTLGALGFAGNLLGALGKMKRVDDTDSLYSHFLGA